MATYFVKNGGSDAADGLSDANAWATVAKVNASAFSAGDIIQFRRGDTWREILTIPSSGSPGNPITFTAYGSGDNPIISGADTISGFSNGGSNIWDAALTTQPFLVVIGSNTAKNMAASRAACTAAGDWFWTANVLSVFATSDPSGTVEAAKRLACLEIGNKNNLTFGAITLMRSNNLGPVPGNQSHVVGFGAATSNLIFQPGFTIFQGAGFGFEISVAVTSLQFDGISITYCGGTGMWFYSGTTTGLSLLRSTLSFNGWRNLMTAGFCSGMVSNVGFPDGEIAYNTVQGNGSGAAGGAGTEHGLYIGTPIAASTLVVHDNVFEDQPKGNGCAFQQTGTLHHNTFRDNGVGGLFVCGNGAVNTETTVHHNTYSGNSFASIYQDGKGAGTFTLNMYHETSYNDGGTIGAPLFLTNTITVLRMKNCIIWPATGRQAIAFIAAVAGTMDVNYNLLNNDNPSTIVTITGVAKTWAQWQALGHDANGINSDPLLVSPPTDLTLQSTSPCINTGVAIAGINDGYYGVGPDIGAFERRPTLVADVSLRGATGVFARRIGWGL